VGYRTYVDTGVLIAALRGSPETAERALAYLDDPLRDYVISDYVRIELLPKCRYHKSSEEESFYNEFFSRSKIFVPSSDELLAFAIDQGSHTGISGMDAIHIACALVSQANEFITAERSTKPIHRATGVKVITVNP
jgi:predicted nucleic acid-binding protein